MTTLVERLLAWSGKKLDENGRAILPCPVCNAGDSIRIRGAEIFSADCACEDDEIEEALVESDGDGDKDEQPAPHVPYDPDDPSGTRRKAKAKKAKGKRKKFKGKKFKRRAGPPKISTALLGRLAVFLPTVGRATNAKAFSVTRTTKWGAVTVEGPRQLSQSHKDLLEALMVIRGKNDSSRVTYTRAELQRHIARRIEHEHRKELLEDLCRVTIRLTDDEGETFMFSTVLNGYKRVGRLPKVEQFGRLVTNPEQKYCVYLSKNYLDLFGKDITLSYPGLVRKICSARHAMSKAVARFLFTHSHKVRYREATLRPIIGATRQHDVGRLHQALAEDAEVLREMGISHDPEKRLLTYDKAKSGVQVRRPKTEDKEQV